MSCENSHQSIRLNKTNAVCPIGEATGKEIENAGLPERHP